MSTLKVNIGANLQGLEKALQTAQSLLNNFGQSLKSTGQTLSTRLTAPIAAMGAVAVKAFADQEKAELQLRAALKANGREVDSLFNSYNQFAKEMQRTTVVGDETTLSMLAQAESLGLTAESAQRAVKNSVAMQSAFGVNAQSALRYTAALEQGNATMLTRYIPTLRDIEDESERVAEAQRILGNAFSSAEAEAQSAGGQLTQMKNALGDFMEQVGGVIAEAILPFVKRLKGLAEQAQNLNPEIIKMGVAVAGVVAAVGPALFILGQMAIAISALMSPITLVIAGLGAFGVAIIHVQQNWEAFKERFSSVAWLQNALIDMLKLVNKLNPFQMLIDSYNLLADVLGMERIESGFENAIDSMRMKLPEFETEISSLKDSLLGFMSDMTGIDFQNPFQIDEGGSGSGGGGGAFGAMGAGIERVAMQYENAGERVKEALQGVQQSTVDTSNQTTETLTVMADSVGELTWVISNAISDMASRFVEDLALIATGSQTMGGLTTNILRSLADLAVKMGKIILGAGLGIEALKKSLSAFTGIGAIAAGAALIAIGTAAKSALSSAASGAGGSTGQGQFERFASDVPSQGGTVEFKIGNDALVGVLQQGSVSSRRTGRTRSLNR